MKIRRFLISALIVLGFLSLCISLSKSQPDLTYLEAQQFKILLQDVLKQVQDTYPEHTLQVAQIKDRLPHLQPDLDRQISRWHEKHPQTSNLSLELTLTLEQNSYRDFIQVQATEITEPSPASFQASRPRIQWTSILPPLVAVTLALLTRRLVFSLFSAILVGSTLAADWQPVQGGIELISKHGWHVITDLFHIQILIFGALLLGMVGIMNVSGGTRGIVESLKRFIASRRSTKLTACIMSLLIFFDDYANCFVLGTTLRPITDRMKISREKLAYLVDSTAAPIAGLAIISTWVGYEVGLFQQALDQIDGMTTGGYQAFIMALPFRFYCILTLIMVFLVVILKRDFGSMYKAELRALEEGLVMHPKAVPLTSKTFNGLDADPGVPLRWYNAAIPIAVVILATLAGLFITGGGLKILAENWSQLFNFQTLATVFSDSDSGSTLLWSSFLGCVSAALLVLFQRLLSPKRLLEAWIKGVSSMGLAAVILVLAWTLNSVANEIGMAPYLISIFRDVVQPLWLPLLIFSLAGAIAFSTGSSWSTMAILIPVAVPLAHELGGTALMLICMAAVLDGAIFGDHCSPLADTSILTSIACSADLMDHVKTQFPYAMVVMLLAAVVCYLPSSAGWSPYLMILLSGGLLAGFLLLFGRDPEKHQRKPDTLPNHLRKPEPAHYLSEI